MLNGTSTAGKARSAATALKALGFNVSDYGNSSSRPATTEIRYAAANELQAKALAAAIGLGALVPDETVTTGVTLIIGKDWTTTTASPTATATQTQTATRTPTPTPSVTTGTVSAGDSGCIDAS